MPSSGHYGEPIEESTANIITGCLKAATEESLELEWWGTFLEGIRKGKNPRLLHVEPV
jgi:hypothetical protein